MYFHELFISHISKFKFCLYQICDIKNQRNFEDDAQGLETQDNQEMSWNKDVQITLLTEQIGSSRTSPNKAKLKKSSTFQKTPACGSSL